MIQSTIKILAISLIAIFTFSCSSEEPTVEVDNRRLPMSDVPDLYFEWNRDGVTATSDEDYQSATKALFGNEMIIGGATGSSVSGDFVFLRINNEGSETVKTGDNFTMDSNSDDEITLRLPGSEEWSTKNPGGSGTCTISSFQSYKDVLFTIDFIEGTFTGTLTSETESGEINIENGAFGLFVWR